MYELRLVDGRAFKPIVLDTEERHKLEQVFLEVTAKDLDNLRDVLRVEVFDRPTWAIPERFVEELTDYAEVIEQQDHQPAAESVVSREDVPESEATIFKSARNYRLYLDLLGYVAVNGYLTEEMLMNVFESQQVVTFIRKMLYEEFVEVKQLAVATTAAAIKFRKERTQVALTKTTFTTSVKVPGLGRVVVGIVTNVVESTYPIRSGFVVPKTFKFRVNGSSTVDSRKLRESWGNKPTFAPTIVRLPKVVVPRDVTSNFIGVLDKAYFWMLENPDAVFNPGEFFETISTMKLTYSWEEEVNLEQLLWRKLLNSIYDLPEQVTKEACEELKAKEAVGGVTESGFTYEKMDEIREIWTTSDKTPEELLLELLQAVTPKFIDSVKFKRFFGVLPEVAEGFQLTPAQIRRVSKGVQSFVEWFYARVPKV